MNMISTGSFLTETGASNKQSELVKKLTAAWEKKNSKTARAGGASLMALSLAACGGEDNTPFSQADIDAAVAAVDITTDNAAAMTSNDAEIAAAAKTEALTAADGTIYASVDAAVTAGKSQTNADAKSEALTAADGTVYTTVDAAIAAGAAGVDITTDNQAAIDAELDGTGFASVAALKAAYDDAIAATPALNVALETTQDIINGTADDDTVAGTNLTYGASDVLVGGAGDDTLTIDSTAATISAAPTVVGFETITYNITSSDLAQAAVTLTNVTSGDVTVNQLANGAATTASITDAGDITLTFGGRITGEATIGQIAASSLNVNVGTADDITITGGTTGTATVTGTAATFVEADVTMAATGTATVVGGSGLATVDVDATNMNVTTTNASSTITLTGMGTADVATVSIGAAASVVNTVTNATTIAETVSISTGTKAGDGTQTAASVATYSGGAATTYNLTGANDIVLAGSEASFDGKTVNSADASGTATLRLTTVADSDLSGVSTGTVIDLNQADALDVGASVDLTVANGANILISADLDSNNDTTDDNLVITAGATGDENISLTFTASQTDVTAADIDVSDFEAIALSTTGATAAVTVTDIIGGTLSAVTLGSGDKGIVFTDMTAKTFDATGFDQSITMTVSTNLSDSATFGSGDDGVTMTSGDTVVLNGGDGVDTLSITGGGDFTTATISNFEVVNIIDGDSQFKVSQLSGKAMSIKGNNGTDDDINIDTGVAGSWDSATLDLSSLVFDSNATEVDLVIAAGSIASDLALGQNFNVTGSSLVDNLTASAVTGDVTFDGKAGADVVVTGNGDDHITGGEGADNITAGQGDDTIVLTEGTAAADTVDLVDTNGSDTIIGFATTSDKLDFSNITGVSAITGSADNNVTTAAAADSVSFATDNTNVITTTGLAADITTAGTAVITDFTNATQVAAYLEELIDFDANANTSEVGIFVLADETGGSSYVWYANDNGDTDNTDLTAADLTLFATVSDALVAQGDIA